MIFCVLFTIARIQNSIVSELQYGFSLFIFIIEKHIKKSHFIKNRIVICALEEQYFIKVPAGYQ